MPNVVLAALIATVITWAVTALGALTVVFMNTAEKKVLNVCLGFAAGVMIAASFWSLLAPAISMAEENPGGLPPWAVVVCGFLAGAVFMRLSDGVLTRALGESKSNRNPRRMRMIMLVLAITLHNIPEGLAVGVAFGAANTVGSEAFFGAVTLAIGIALQNFPEGAAVSLPLRREGCSAKKSFLIGQVSALVEPVAGVIGACLAFSVREIMPYMLSFAAGVMILVAVHELIPECQNNTEDSPYHATLGIVCGFAFMMLLDVALG